MSNLFNYQTLTVSLCKKFKSLKVELNRPDKQNAINSEMIFELESLFSWATSHLEINSIFLTSSSDLFSNGQNHHDAQNISTEQLNKLLLRLQKIIYSMYFLPQTILVDLKNGASGIGAELALGADIRIAHNQAILSFAHASEGLVPTCGGVGILGSIIPKSYARNWLLSSKQVNTQEMMAAGFISDAYQPDDRVETIETILQQINDQSPVARIQTKRSLLNFLMPLLENSRESENKFAFANLQSGDWKTFLESKDSPGPNPKINFANIKEFSTKVKIINEASKIKNSPFNQ